MMSFLFFFLITAGLSAVHTLFTPVVCLSVLTPFFVYFLTIPQLCFQNTDRRHTSVHQCAWNSLLFLSQETISLHDVIVLIGQVKTCKTATQFCVSFTYLLFMIDLCWSGTVSYDVQEPRLLLKSTVQKGYCTFALCKSFWKI